DHNRIEAIPEQIGRLHGSLTELSCSDNAIQRITSGIFQLTSLIRLSLAHNKIKSLPEACSRLTMLRHLDLDYNQIQHNEIKSLPEACSRLTMLRHLDLDYNQIQECSRLKMLRHLDLDYNQIQSLPDSLLVLSRLQNLLLEANPVSFVSPRSLPDSLAVLSRLQNLLLEANPVSFVSPDSFINCKGLRLLKIQAEWLDDLKAWRKDTSMFKMIAGNGVTFPPTEVMTLGTEALWKYLVLVAKSKTTLALDLSRTNFWMLELEQQGNK
ncbi:hypothetical protein T484DRAFT_1762963, partial [Baffinella frigidus]